MRLIISASRNLGPHRRVEDQETGPWRKGGGNAIITSGGKYAGDSGAKSQTQQAIRYAFAPGIRTRAGSTSPASYWRSRRLVGWYLRIRGPSSVLTSHVITASPAPSGQSWREAGGGPRQRKRLAVGLLAAEMAYLQQLHAGRSTGHHRFCVGVDAADGEGLDGSRQDNFCTSNTAVFVRRLCTK